MNRRGIFLKGLRDGIPIAMGYYAVAFSLGIVARKAGLSSVEGFFGSLFTRASAGEYGVYSLMMVGAAYAEVVIMCFITNIRYLLMSTALSQRLPEKTSLLHRIAVASCVTDEIFGISIAYPGMLNPYYTYGATAIAGTFWALGTTTGIVAGNILPANIVSALSVALYGMFIAIVIPPAKKDRAVLIAVIISFVASGLCAFMPYISQISSGMRTILLTIVISAVAALLKPINKEKKWIRVKS